MLGTTIFDEADSSSVFDIRIDNNNSNNTSSRLNNNNFQQQSYCEYRPSNDTSFVSECGRFQVASWVDPQQPNTAKIIILDRTAGYRPPKLVRISTSNQISFALGSFVIAQVPSSTGNNNNDDTTTTSSSDLAEMELDIVLSAGGTANPRLFFVRLLAVLDETNITVQKMRQNVTAPIMTDEQLQRNGAALDSNNDENGNNTELSSFGLCSNTDQQQETITVAVGLTNGLVFLVRLQQLTGEQVDQLVFSVDALSRKATEDARKYDRYQQLQALQQQQQQEQEQLQQQQQQQQQNDNNNNQGGGALGKLFGWIASSASGNNNNNNNSQLEQEQAFNERLRQEIDNLSTSFVTSLSFCPQTNNLFLCCIDGTLLVFNIETSTVPERVNLESHLRVCQVLSAEKSAAANAIRMTAIVNDEENNNNSNNNSSNACVYIVCDDITTFNTSPARYLMTIDTQSFVVRNHWSAPSSSSHSRCVRIEPPSVQDGGEGLDMCYATWTIPENEVSILWSPAFGVAYVSMRLLSFFIDTSDAMKPFNVVTPNGKVMSIRESNRMTSLEITIASVAVASRPALDFRNTVLFPTNCDKSGAGGLLAHPVGGSDLIYISEDLPAPIKTGIRIISNTQMWKEFEGLLAKTLSDPDSSSNLGWFNHFADIVAISSSSNNSNNNRRITAQDMSDVIAFLLKSENLVTIFAESPVRTRRWISDRLSQSLFTGAVGLLLARVAFACYGDASSLASSDLNKKMNQTSLLFASGFHAASSLGPQTTLLIERRARDENDSDIIIIEKCMGTLLRGKATSIAAQRNNADDEVAAVVDNNNKNQKTIVTQKAVLAVAARLLKACQESGRSKPLSMWIAFWKKDFPIVCHYDAVLIASHHTQDARPGVASMLFAQALQTTCSTLTTTSSTTSSSDDNDENQEDSDNSNNDDAAPTAAGSGMFSPDDDENENNNNNTTSSSSSSNSNNNNAAFLARTIFDLLQGTTAALPDLGEITQLLHRAESFAIFEACRLYRSAMLLLFLNGGGNATFNCEPDLVESLLCDVKRAVDRAIESNAGQLERLLSYLLVESSLFLASVDVHRRQFFSALQHLSSVCRNDPTRTTSVNELVGVIVQNVLDDREAQHQLVKAGINDEPLLRAVNEALIESIMQPTPANSATHSREERDTARVQHTVFFVQFLAARGALGSAARVAHDVASRMRSFQRCNVSTLRNAANLIALSIAICRTIPDVQPPNIVAGYGTGGSRSSTGGSRAPEMVTGMGGNDLDFQTSFAGGNGMVSGKTMVFTPQGIARKPLCRRHVPELNRRLLWILCEAKLASRAPVDRPAWSDDLDQGGENLDATSAEPLLSTVRELLHLRMWNDALRLCDAYPETLHPGCVFQVRIHDLLSSDLWNKNNSNNKSDDHDGNNKLSIEAEVPLPVPSSSSSSSSYNYQVSLRQHSIRSMQSSNNDDEDEDSMTKERKLFLTEQWKNLVDDLENHPRRTDLLRSAIEQTLAHPNGDLVPRFVFDRLGDADPATLFELCMNCSRVSFRITDIAFDIVLNYFEKKKYAHLRHVVLSVTMLDRLVIGARKLSSDPRLSSSVPGYVLQKAPRVDQLVSNHFKQ